MAMTFKATEIIDFDYINKFLNIPEDVDITCTGEADIIYELVPDETRYGLNGIDIIVRSITGTIEWNAAEEFLTDYEKLAIKAAGGVLMNNGYYEGQFDLNINTGSEDWMIDVEAEFTSSGSFYFDGIMIDGRSKIITL